MDRMSPRIRRAVSPRRWEHIQAVTALALELAAVHQVSPLLMAQAALLHDVAKNLPEAALRRRLAEAGADVWETRLPALWHAVVGARVARTNYGVVRREVLSAIRCHSTGLPGATPLQKIMVIADRLEPGRREKGLTSLRALAFQDLDLAYRGVMEKKIRWLLDHQRAVHPRALAAWNDLAQQKNEITQTKTH